MSQLKSFNLLIDTIGSSNGKEATIPSFGAILGPIVAILLVICGVAFIVFALRY